MTKDQLAAARRVMNEFPLIRIRKDGSKLTLVGAGGVQGPAIEVAEAMSDAALRNQIMSACRSLQ